VEIVSCEQWLALTLLDGLAQSNYQAALRGLCIQQANTGYTHEQLCLSLVLLAAWGVARLSHINDQPVEGWGVLLDKPRRPDGDTLDQCLNQIIALDEADSDTAVAQRLGQIRPGGIIDIAQQESCRYWVEAGLTEGDIWYFDDHVIEYTGQARIGKTKHGTKHTYSYPHHLGQTDQQQRQTFGRDRQQRVCVHGYGNATWQNRQATDC